MSTPAITLSVNDKFGEWTVIVPGIRGSDGRVRYVCQCACGKYGKHQAKALVAGKTLSCRSCAQLGNTKNLVHGGSRRSGRTPEYNSWHAMQQRCSNPEDPAYSYYGYRGIRVCRRWCGTKGFAHFLSDMGNRLSKDTTLDRIDPDGPYAPKNCRWASKKAQQRNRRDNIWVETDSKRLLLVDYSEQSGIPYTTARRKRVTPPSKRKRT